MSTRCRRGLLALAIASASLVMETRAASAQAELAGTYIRYLRVGTNGRLCDTAAARSMAYSEAGDGTDASCDLYGPGTPAVGFTLSARAGSTTVSAINDLDRSDVARLSGPSVSGRSIVWSGRRTSGAIILRVDQTISYEPADRHAVLSVEITNEGSVPIDDLYYFFSGDPDHGECNIGTTYETLNDVVRQQPADGSALATATAGTSRTYTYAIGSRDPRARANNGGFGNTEAVTAWSSPIDQNGALRDEDIGIVFRESPLAPGASTTFVALLVWGRSVAEAVARFDDASASPNGAPCTSGRRCESTFCVDGVCCDGACGGGAPGDCQACSISAGAVVDGTCALLPSGRVCRPDVGPCDAPEACNGSSSACPGDGLRPSGTVCRAGTDLCDAPETCSGASVACPSDGLALSGTPCRAAEGACDIEETCTGVSRACPADVRVLAGTVCRPAESTCDIAEVCDGASACPADLRLPDGTSCSDGLACNGEELCAEGFCVEGATPSCDDLDPCTADTCREPGGCASAPIAGCCRSNAECDDGDACTTDTCGASRTCASTPVAGCPATDAGTGPRDAGDARSDASTDAGAPLDAGSRGELAAGCGCHAIGASRPDPSWLWLALAALALARSRRRC